MKAASRLLCLLQRSEAQRLEGMLQGLDPPAVVTWVDSPQAFSLALAGSWAYDLAVVDDGLPEHQGALLLGQVRERCPELPLLFLGDGLEEAAAARYLDQGATDCLAWSRLGHGVRRALREAQQGALLREAQQDNRRRAALLRATLDSTAEGILIVDMAGRIAAYNNQFVALSGLPGAVLAPMELDHVLRFLQEQFDSPETLLNAAAVLGAKQGTTALFQDQAGRVLEGRAQAFAGTGFEGGSVFSLLDATEREKQARSLQRTVSGLEDLLEAAAIAGVAPWRLSEGRLLMADASWAILEPGQEGLPADLQALEARVHPDDLDRFRQALELPGPGRIELRMRGPEGWTWTRWTLDRLPGGEVAGTIQDIDQERLLGEQTLHRARFGAMAQVTRDAARTLGEPSRKLRVRLGTLENSRPLTEAQTRHLAAAQAAQAGLDALLTFMAGPEPAWGPHPALDLNELLEGLRPRLAASLPEGVWLRFELAPHLPALACSSAHLEQMVLELISNARDALGEAGEVRLRTGLLAQGGVFLEVEDDGPGLKEPECASEPFYTTKPGARGLGLWAVRTLVEGYGGALVLKSNGKGGACVSVSLPAGAGDPGPAP